MLSTPRKAECHPSPVVSGCGKTCCSAAGLSASGSAAQRSSQIARTLGIAEPRPHVRSIQRPPGQHWGRRPVTVQVSSGRVPARPNAFATLTHPLVQAHAHKRSHIEAERQPLCQAQEPRNTQAPRRDRMAMANEALPPHKVASKKTLARAPTCVAQNTTSGDDLNPAPSLAPLRPRSLRRPRGRRADQARARRRTLR